MPRFVRVVLFALLTFVSMFVTGCRSAAHPKGDVPYIENDYARALAEAKRTHRPIVVDAWASWCEPCKKMAASMGDPAVSSLRDRFVWASLDADEDANADALKRLGMRGLPTVWVVEPEGEHVVWSTSIAEDGSIMRRLLIGSE